MADRNKRWGGQKVFPGNIRNAPAGVLHVGPCFKYARVWNRLLETSPRKLKFASQPLQRNHCNFQELNRNSNSQGKKYLTTGPTKVSLQLIFLAVKAKWPEIKILKLPSKKDVSHRDPLSLGKIPKTWLHELGIEVLLKIMATFLYNKTMPNSINRQSCSCKT